MGELTARHASAAGTWRGVVTRVTPAGRVFVRVIGLSRQEYGPLEVADRVHPAGLVSQPAADGHTHTVVTPLASGSRVLVQAVRGRGRSVDFVVTDRLS